MNTHASQAVAVNNMQVRTSSKMDNLTTIIEDALQNRHFSMVYQPLFSMQTSKLVGFEALVRCQSPQFGFISPDKFIPHAEQNGQIIELGDWIFKQVLLDLKRFLQYGLKDITVSINVSAVQIAETNIFEQIMTLVKKLDIPTRCIKLELTETALIKNPQVIAKVFQAFQQEGIQVWVDDFGTGFASLSLLREFKINGLKIDKSFVDGIATCNEDFTLCSAIIAMAQRLGMHIVAEGIEDETQLQILNQLGCDTAQGYLLGRPVSIDENLRRWGRS
ncbi:EAL domain-containing protein [Colwellia sp. Arc7-D]|jgi:EAL domain-containing protein (putative c-di-GMP-specific phosphodiesterase class I)|uniref:putative bifunctional diguanylate cyclase/phosphodiesterase n=1 Tax=Colwellia sp. Arc7-D TaxID=2161872 RepID=UPI001EF3C22F|nr:EAL domain-containing protein [Colwellia sp. Arc7-D]|tara:strand:+ start:472 stop:1299 length:828 start_codon:yes stop_codon:yes gene_type:complete